MGNGSVIRPGDVQRMSAGTGVFHSEQNPSRQSPVHFLQIWIRPDRLNVAPGYEQKYFSDAEKRGRLRLIVSGDGAEESVRMHQDARLYAGLFDGVEHATLGLAHGRRGYVHVVRGELQVNGTRLSGGDALKLIGVEEISIDGGQDAEVLVFDLPAEA
jgi:redox-sensitive bicupin YhaK (pirin superfamily)